MKTFCLNFVIFILYLKAGEAQRGSAASVKVPHLPDPQRVDRGNTASCFLFSGLGPGPLLCSHKEGNKQENVSNSDITCFHRVGINIS